MDLAHDADKPAAGRILPEPAPGNGLSCTRRALLAVAALATGAAVTPGRTHAAPAADHQFPVLHGTAFAPLHRPKPLSFDATRLRGLSQVLIESHWANNYGGSVRTLNAVKEKLAAAATDPAIDPYVYNGLKREHLLRSGSVVLHELYFACLGGNGQSDATIRRFIGASFGGYDAWETEFRRIAAGLGGGAGWVVLAYNAHFATLENYWLADHMHFPAGSVPLLVLDMYEHSYQMDYGAAAAKYIDAAFANFNWEIVLERIEAIGCTDRA